MITLCGLYYAMALTQTIQLLSGYVVYNFKFENLPIACVGGCSICKLKVGDYFLWFNYTREQRRKKIPFEYKVCADCCMSGQYVVQDENDVSISLKERYMEYFRVVEEKNREDYEGREQMFLPMMPEASYFPSGLF